MDQNAAAASQCVIDYRSRDIEAADALGEERYSGRIRRLVDGLLIEHADDQAVEARLRVTQVADEQVFDYLGHRVTALAHQFVA